MVVERGNPPPMTSAEEVENLRDVILDGLGYPSEDKVVVEVQLLAVRGLDD